MRFAFTDDQRGFRDSLRDMLAKECPPKAVRAAWLSDDGRVPGLWPKLGEMGLLGVLAPAEHGGLGLGEVDLVLPLEEAGRAALPGPLIEHAAVAVPLLDAFSPSVASARWLAAAAGGEISLTAAVDGDPLVANADSADVLLLRRGDALHALARDRVELTRQTSVDGARRLFTVEWEGSAETELARGDAAREALARAFDRGAFAASAVLLGLSAAALELTVGYVTVREQFGKPIGSFQAIKHQLANALTALEMARPLVHRAAWSLASGDADASLHASIAKARASTASHAVARAALQCHGAIGYSTEYDLHLWMKRIWALGSAWGDPGFHRRRIAARVIDGAEQVYP